MPHSEVSADQYLSDLFGFRNRVVLVTGGSRGIGAAIANGLAMAGATTYAIGRSEQGSPELSPLVHYLSCDITDTEAFQKVVEQISNSCAAPDVLVNAAGITMPSGDFLQDADAFRKTLDINLTAIYNCCDCVAGRMKNRNGGSIINVTSIGSSLGFPGNPGYVASKGGLKMLTKALAVDLADHGIRVNNVAPGYIHTEMTTDSYNDSEKHNARLEHMLIKRWGQPQDLVGAVLYLASSASSYVTGIDLFVDGGWTTKGL
jgi:NAD(P)-dependent dehydrogenase (short-subunit alcohol dehydrogenase family)